MSDQSTRVSITTPEIRQGDYETLVRELVANSIDDDSSPFYKVRRILKDELDADSTMDPAQKVGVLAGFLKDTYSDINKQAMTAALDLMKTNQQLVLEKYKVESEYNKANQEWTNGQEVQLGLAKDNTLKDKEVELADEKITNQKLDNYKIRAELKKQWGVYETISATYGDGSGYVTGVGMQDGTIRFYKADIDGNLLANQATVDAYNTANGTSEVYGVFTTTNTLEAELVRGSSAQVSTDINKTIEPGAVDKQIIGYDQVNQKDMMKTYNELYGMLSNSQNTVPCWIGEAIAMLSNKVVPGSAPTDAAMKSACE